MKFIFICTRKIKTHNIVLADVYDLVTSIFTIGGILQTLFIPAGLAKFKFSVTKKDTCGLTTHYKYKLTLVTIFIILIFAELQGIYDIFYSNPYSVLAIIANLFWNTTNIIVVAYGIKVVSEQPEKRFYQRVEVDGSVVIKDKKNKNFDTDVNDISRSGVSITSEELRNVTGKDINIKIEDEDNAAELIGCQETKGKYVCKSKFKRPIALYRLSRIYTKRLIKFVKFAYKNPDKWDTYFNEKK